MAGNHFMLYKLKKAKTKKEALMVFDAPNNTYFSYYLAPPAGNHSPLYRATKYLTSGILLFDPLIKTVSEFNSVTLRKLSKKDEGCLLILP